METIQSIHEAAIQCAKAFKRAEGAMLECGMPPVLPGRGIAAILRLRLRLC